MDEYWIAKNSWGTGWNGDGYFKIGYSECGIDESWFIVNDSATYCDIDIDGDGLSDFCDDNCPDEFNPDQVDVDNDGVGDLCDNCIDDYNPTQIDTDSDGIADACDPCTDTDDDGYGDPAYLSNICPGDNCPNVYNPDQSDVDSDGIGDACYAGVWYVSTLGSDVTGDGSEGSPFATIQFSIDNVPENGKIIVKPGIYYENISIVDKNLYIFGEDKETTIIEGGGVIRDCISIWGVGGDGIISGFTIRQAKEYGIGIGLWKDTYELMSRVV